MVLSTLSVVYAPLADARIPRSAKAIQSFKAHNPCPITGEQKGPCPGYIIDHIKPLCDGGTDSPDNMQWQTVDEAKAKDREERKACCK